MKFAEECKVLLVTKIESNRTLTRAGNRFKSPLMPIVLVTLAMWFSGCGMLPPPITMASPKKNVARAIESFIRDKDTLYVLPTQVDYERRGLWFPQTDSTEIHSIAQRADWELVDYMRDQWQKEIVLVSDPIAQSQIMGDPERVYFQLWLSGFSRTKPRRILSEIKSFILLGPTFGYNMNCPIGTSSDMVLLLRRGGKKTKPIYKQKDEDDINPADPADLKWQVRRMINPQYSEG